MPPLTRRAAAQQKRVAQHVAGNPVDAGIPHRVNHPNQQGRSSGAEVAGRPLTAQEQLHRAVVKLQSDYPRVVRQGAVLGNNVLHMGSDIGDLKQEMQRLRDEMSALQTEVMTLQSQGSVRSPVPTVQEDFVTVPPNSSLKDQETEILVRFMSLFRGRIQASESEDEFKAWKDGLARQLEALGTWASEQASSHFAQSNGDRHISSHMGGRHEE